MLQRHRSKRTLTSKGFAHVMGLATPNLTSVRKALHGKTYRPGVAETRGRKRKLARRMVLSMNSTGKALAAITPWHSLLI